MFYVKINWEIISPWNSLKYMMIRSAGTKGKVSGFSLVQLLSLIRLRLPCPSLIPGASSNSSLSSWWCHPTISPSVVAFSYAFNLCQHQGPFYWVSSSHQVAKVLEFQLQNQSFQWIFRTTSFRIDWFGLLSVQGTLKSLLQHHSSKASILRHSTFFTV